MADLLAPARTLAVRLKAAAAMVFSGRGGQGWGWWGNWPSGRLPGTTHDYLADVGDGGGSALVVSALRWVGRTFPEAPPRVRERQSDGTLQDAPDHPLVALLARPNPAYSGLLLFSAALADWMLGNGYVRKVRSGAGRVVELWWLPSWTVEPRWPDDGRTFISHYDYRPDAARDPERIPPKDILHLRNGLDPSNVRKGLSPLGSLLREIATDNEAANFTAAILRNLGVPGVVLSPEAGQTIGPQAAEDAKRDFKQRFGGDNRGEPLVTAGPTKVTVLSFSPSQMNLKDLRRIPEERVAAVIGIPASVLGFGAGMDRNTFSNAEQEDEKATERFLVPTWRLIGADVQHQLLPDFGDPARLAFDFDLSRVRALAEDEDNLHKRARGNLSAGLVTLDEAREMIGRDALPGGLGDVFYVPLAVGLRTAGGESIALLQPQSVQEAITGGSTVSEGGMRALPPGKARDGRVNGANGAGKMHKGTEDLVIPLTREDDGRYVFRMPPGVGPERIWGLKAADPRSALAERLQSDVDRYLRQQAARVLRRLDALGDAPLPDDALLPAGTEQRLLTRLLRGSYERALAEAEAAATERLGRDAAIPDAEAQRILADASGRAADILETSRDRIRAAFAEGVLPDTLAETLTDAIASEGRAEVIARTETAEAFGQGTALAYRDAGVERVLISDGDGDPGCAAVDGTEQTVEWWLEHSLQHPNCSRDATPVESEAEAVA